jgi:hypothetical protein
MYWAAHDTDSKLFVTSWKNDRDSPENAASVMVEKYVPPIAQTVAGSEPKNRKPWLNRLDDRITAGWQADGNVGFAWSSGSIYSAGSAIYPFPHIRVAIIDKSTLDSGNAGPIEPSAQPHIWSSRFAMAYASAVPNGKGDIGVALYFGGPPHFPSAAVGMFKKTGSDWVTTLTVLREGKNTPRCATLKPNVFDNSCGKWGDYLNVRPSPKVENGWHIAVATEEDTGATEKPKIVVTFAHFYLAKAPKATTSVAARPAQ